MALVSWRLSQELTASQWERLMSVLSTLLEKGVPVLLEQQQAQAPTGWRGWVQRHQRQLFVKLNTPAFAWGMGGKGYDRVSMELLPGHHSVADRLHAHALAIRSTRLPHTGEVELAERLYATAWLAALLWARKTWPHAWHIQTDLPSDEIAGLEVWINEFVGKI